MDRIDAMRAFAAVAQEGSFTGAGQYLGTSTKQVSKQVAQLEAHLRAQLFNRTTRSVSLTDVGTAYLQRCRPLLEQFDELEAVVQDRQTALAGPIRMTAPTGFGSMRLPAALMPFLTAHPDVALDLTLSDSRLSLVEEGIDLAIRIGTMRDSTLVARRLADMPRVVCAAPSYLEDNGTPQHPAALSSHACLIDDNSPDPAVWRFFQGGKEIAVPIDGRIRVNAPRMAAELAAGGLGIARSPFYTVQRDLADGTLVAILTDYQAPDSGLYAVYPPNRHLTARVRALIDHLAEAFRGGFEASDA